MIQERLQQLIDSLGWNQDRLAREMVTNPSTVSRWFSGSPISKTSIKRLSAVTGASVEWIETGRGPMKTAAGEAQEDQPDINVHEGVMMTTKVLSSKTGYANALWHNLKSFDAAVEREREMGDLTEKVDALTKMVQGLQEKLGVVATPEGPAKKREANG